MPDRADVRDAAARMDGLGLSITPELRRLDLGLDPSETVLELAAINAWGSASLLLGTDRRLFILDAGWLKRDRIEEFPLIGLLLEATLPDPLAYPRFPVTI